VILTSASVNYKTAEMLGIPDEECTVDEYPHTFPVENRMVYLIQGGRINSKADGETLHEWLRTADLIIEDRLDRKGIFHTTAYHRRDFVTSHSRFLRYMMSHNRKDVVEVVQKFRESAPPKVLVSPAVTTGFDFPYTDCEFQILGKVPYPDTRNVITKARADRDKEYAPYIAMQQIIQASGRGCRAEDDFCETFIIDDNIQWFLRKYHKFAPQWFLDSVTSRIFPPQPPKKLERRS
jgi:Rad3-related DNA helicase